MNYFDLMGLEERYDISVDDLQISYIKLQKKYHPDSLDYKIINFSIKINEAYRTLKDNLMRANYLLKLHNFEVNNYSLKSEILFEIFDRNENIESVSKKLDLENHLISTNKTLEDINKNLIDYFSNKNYIKALQDTVRMKYIINIKKVIQNKLLKCQS